MSDITINNWYSSVVIYLLFCFPVVIGFVKVFGNLILFIILFLGIIVAISQKTSPFKIAALRSFSFITVGYFLVMFLSIVFANEPSTSFLHLGRKVHFMLAPFIALAIYQVNWDINRLLLSLKVGLIILGSIVLTQYFLGIERPSGMINANIFGDLVVMMLFLSVVKVFEENRQNRILTLSAVLMGLVAIILSCNRGSIITLIILSTSFIFLNYNHYLRDQKKHQLIVFILFSIILCIFFSQQNVRDRVILANQEISQWINNEHKNTSVGLRLEMWSSSLQAFQDSPWIGVGYRNANIVVARYADDKTKDAISNFTHLHNEYITNLVSAGILGLGTLLTLLIIPLRLFIKNIHHKELYFHSVMGIMLCIGYASFGLTHIAFGEEHMNAFYVFFLSMLMPYVKKQELSSIMNKKWPP
jgi:O-antigen ligase